MQCRAGRSGPRLAPGGWDSAVPEGRFPVAATRLGRRHLGGNVTSTGGLVAQRKQPTYPEAFRQSDIKEGFLMKTYFGILAAGALAACGSSNGSGGTTPPPLGNFTYSSPQPANGTQQSQASNAQQQVPDVVTGATTGSATQAANAPSLADEISASALDARVLPPNPAYSTVGKLMKAARSGGLDDPNCLVETTTTITYKNCSSTSGGSTITLNGSLSVGTNSVTWDLTFTGSFSSAGESENVQGEWKGNITVTGDSSNGSINGQATSSFSGDIVSGSTNESYAYTAGVDFLNLTYTATCQGNGGFFTSGTLEVRRNVAESGTFTAPVDNAAVEFTWTGCDTVNIAIGSD